MKSWSYAYAIRWNGFSAGFTVGGLSGAAFSYILTQILPYYY
jgi:hypothetical protein